MENLVALPPTQIVDYELLVGPVEKSFVNVNGRI